MKFPLELAIGDEWVPVEESADVTFPYDGSLIAQTPVGNTDLATAAIDHAVSIRDAMAAMPSHARRKVLTDTRDDLAARVNEIEQTLVLETGKPLIDCKVEVARTLLTLQTAADEISKLHGETVPLDVSPAGEGMFGFWVRKPIGVVVAITGFNYPLLLAVHKLAPAIAAGCPVIIKPPPQAPITTIMLVTLLRGALAAAGGPEGGVQLVTGGPEVGAALTTDRRVGCVSFTGSAAVGHQIARAAAPTKVVLELGANAALIVAADADLDAAADAVIRGGYYANGQACISIQRVIVVDAVKDAFMAKLLSALRKVIVGDPRRPETRVAALIDSGSTGRVRSWVYSAVSSGATLVAGGGVIGTALEPTVLLDVPDGADAWDEEIFGPVVAVRGVADLDAAYDTLNNSRYGLHCSIFTSSLATAYDAIDRIEAGGIVVNEVPGFRSDIAPYGGVKDSGIGREGPRFAMEEMTVTRMVAIRPSTR